MLPWILALATCTATGAGASPKAEAKPRLVVMPLTVTGLPEGAAVTLNELLVISIRRLDEHDVLGQSDLAAMLQLDSSDAALGCDEVSCAAEIGGALPF